MGDAMDGAESQAHPTFDFVELQIQIGDSAGFGSDVPICEIQGKHVVRYFLRAQSDKSRRQVMRRTVLAMALLWRC